MRESGNLREAKNNARINDGIPDVNMRKERRVMMIYASRPVARNDVMPRKPAMLDRIDVAMAPLVGSGANRREPTLKKSCYLLQTAIFSEAKFEQSRGKR